MKEKKTKAAQIVIIAILCVQLIATGGIIVYLAGERGGGEAGSVLEYTEKEKGKYVLYIGTNDKDTYTQLIPLDEAKEKVNEICSRYVDGYTVQTAEGGWVDETGTLTEEQTLVYSFDEAEEADIISIMNETLKELNQNSILVEKEDLNYCYYSGEEG